MKKIFTLTALSSLLLCSCATYHITTQSLMEQFAGVGKEKKNVSIVVAPPFFFFSGSVEGNDLRSITVLDKKDKPHTINVGRHTGVRITRNNGQKTTFYFNTLLLKDSTISGSKTHFFNAQIKPVKFADIRKIELQK